MDKTVPPRSPLEPQQPDPQINTAMDLCKLAMDSPGYVMVMAQLSPQKDAQGRNLMQMHYRRYQMSFEDCAKVLSFFHEELEKDLQRVHRGLHAGGEDGAVPGK